MSRLKLLFLVTAFFCLISCGGRAVAGNDKNNDGFKWEMDKNVSVALHGYVQADAYGVNRSSASFGTGALDSQPLDTDFRRAFINIVGKIFDWRYLVSYDLTSGGGTPKNGIIWAFASHNLGPGQLSIGEHWNFSALEDTLSARNFMFLERNFQSASGTRGLRTHAQGVFYQQSNPYGDGSNNIFLSASAYSLNNTLISRNGSSGYGGTVAARWAPVVKNTEWYQIGSSFTYEKAHNNWGLNSTITTYTGPSQLPSINVADYETINGANPSNYNINANVAGAYKELFLLGEYSYSKYSQSGAHNDGVQALALEAGYWLTGETTPFNRAIASYGVPKPIHKYGAIQLAAGYDFVENTGVDGQHDNSHPHCTVADTTNAFDAQAVDRCRIQQFRVAASYWMNPNIRFTGQITKSVADLGKAGEDDPFTYVARMQFEF